MGAFFSNIQIRRGRKQPKAFLTSLTEALQASLGKDYIPADPKFARKSFVVVPPKEGLWYTVYDLSADPTDEDWIKDLGEALSKSTGEDAVSVSIHDSESLNLHRFKKGKLKASYYGFRNPVVEPKEWKDLAPEGDAKKVLTALETPSYLMAEDRLVELAEAAGWDPELVSAGGPAVVEEGLLTSREAITLGFSKKKVLDLKSRLALISRRSTTVETSETPKFSVRSVSYNLELDVDEHITLSAKFGNDGQAGRGLQIEVVGSAVDEGAVLLEPVAEVAVLPSSKAAQPEKVHVKLARSEKNGKVVWAGTAPEIEYSGLLEHDESAPPAEKAAGPMDSWLSAQVTVSVDVTGQKRGHGEVQVRLIPLTNAKQGRSAYTTEVQVGPYG